MGVSGYETVAYSTILSRRSQSKLFRTRKSVLASAHNFPNVNHSPKMSTFTPNCSLPSDFVNYVSSPNTRGTLDILWSCLATILLCTWSIQHPNIPALWRPKTWVMQCMKYCVTIANKVQRMLVTLFAINQRISATYVTTYITAQSRRNNDSMEWTLTHSFYANMGGFVIRFTEETPSVR
jgi:hypothetical protein